MQRAIIEVRWGPLQGRKAVIEPGTTLKVGRTERADLVVPHDGQMSGLHFELGWDGEKCRLRDLKSAKGTLLSGEHVDEAEIVNGDWVRAGATDFSVYFEGATPARVKDEEDDDYEPETAEMVACKERALEVLNGEDEPLFAVLDAARDDRIVELLRESVEEYQSLYEGIQGEALAEVAPYLVRLPKGARLLEALVREGWGKRWGVYLTCLRPFKEVRRHLRRLLMIEREETGEQLYFRFYDPGVLQTFLPTCAVRQREEFWGEVVGIFMEAEGGELLRHQGGK